MKNKQNKRISLIMVAVIVLGLSGCNSATGASNAEQNSEQTPAVVDTDVTIDKAGLSKKAQFIPVVVDGTALEIIAVTAPDGTVRTAFNTCQICYDSGRGYYVQEGDALVCQNCGNQFTMSQVEVESGGCNPVPLFNEQTVETDDTITVPLSTLQEAKAIFANWKSNY